MKIGTMLSLLAIACSVFGLVSGQQCNIVCPRNISDGSCIDGNLPNPEDCGSFCQCVACVPHRINCPGDMHYDPNTDSCINREQSTCVESTIQPLPSTPAPVSGLIVFAANVGDLNTDQDPLVFDGVLIDRGSHMEAASRITIPASGLYLITLSAGAASNVGLNYFLVQDGWYRTAIHRLSTSHINPDTSGRDILSYVNYGERLWIASQSLRAYSSPLGLETSFGVVDVASVIGTSPAFSVARASDFGTGHVPFTDILVNQGNGWSSSQNRFVVPTAGVYFFSWSLGVNGGVPVNFDLMINGVEVADIYRMHTDHNNADTLGRSALFYVNAGDTVHISTVYPGLAGIHRQTSFHGFRYAPTHGMSVAWAAYRTSNLTSGASQVHYNSIRVNLGSAFSSNQAVCPYSGYYYVHLSAGALPHTPVELTLMLDGFPQGRLTRSDVVNSNVDTLSRSMIVPCNQNQVMWVSSAAGTGLFSDPSLQTGFLGMFLSPY